MPTYEYACRDCGTHTEVVQSFTDEPLSTCPSCGGPVRKVFSAVGITFRGSGFYKTDSRTSAKATTPSTTPAASGDGPSSPTSGSGSSDSGSSDSGSSSPAPSTSGSGAGAGSGSSGSGGSSTPA